MKRLMLFCVCLAMSIVSAVAQCNNCISCRCHCNNQDYTNVYYPFVYKGTTIKFNGSNAYIAAKHLMHAKERYFLNINDNYTAPIRVYKLKDKDEYLIRVGVNCFFYNSKYNYVESCQFNQYQDQVKKEIFRDSDAKNGLILGKDDNERMVLAIYAD